MNTSNSTKGNTALKNFMDKYRGNKVPIKAWEHPPKSGNYIREV
jgi:hypothetical protein